VSERFREQRVFSVDEPLVLGHQEGRQVGVGNGPVVGVGGAYGEHAMAERRQDRFAGAGGQRQDRFSSADGGVEVAGGDGAEGEVDLDGADFA
jgi:hypothetical protein